MAKKFDKCGSGYVPCNAIKWRRARLILYRGSIGLVSVEFSDKVPFFNCHGSIRDGKGNPIDYAVYVKIYGNKVCHVESSFPDREKPYRGIAFWEDSIITVPFSRKSLPSGDIRDFVSMALKQAGLPTDFKGWFLVAKDGEFWGRPNPDEGE